MEQEVKDKVAKEASTVFVRFSLFRTRRSVRGGGCVGGR